MRSSHTGKVEYETYDTTEDHKSFHDELGEDKSTLKRGSCKGLVWGWRTLTSLLLLTCLVILIYQIGKHDQHHRAQEEVSKSSKNSTSTVLTANPTQPTGSITRTEPIGCQGWIIIQRRGQYGNPADFFSSKLWDDFEKGFGNNGRILAGLGDNFQHDRPRHLGVVGGAWRFPEQDLHRTLPQLQGPPESVVQTQHLSISSLQDSLSVHNSHAFTTKDRDNDVWAKNCATEFLGAWWYTACHSSNLNGYNYNRGDLPHEKPKYYAKGIIWRNEGNVAEQDHYFSWPKAEMKIRRKGCW